MNEVDQASSALPVLLSSYGNIPYWSYPWREGDLFRLPSRIWIYALNQFKKWLFRPDLSSHDRPQNSSVDLYFFQRYMLQKKSDWNWTSKRWESVEKGSSIDRKMTLLNDEKVAYEMPELSRSRPFKGICFKRIHIRYWCLDFSTPLCFVSFFDKHKYVCNYWYAWVTKITPFPGLFINLLQLVNLSSIKGYERGHPYLRIIIH